MILASGAMGVLLGIGHLLRTAENRSLTFGLVILAVGLLQIAGSQLPPASLWNVGRAQALLQIHSALKLLLGPLLFFFFEDLAGINRRFRARDLAHFLPCALWSAVVLFPEALAGPQQTSTLATATEVIRYSVTGSTTIVAAYIVLGVLRFDLVSLWHTPWGRPAFGFALAVVCLLPALASWMLFWMNPDPAFLYGAHLAGAGVIFLFVVLAERFPGLFLTIRAESRRFGKSQLEGLDLRLLELRLRALMVEEFVYRDEQLTLPRLATLMDLSVHQLSRLLNEHVGQSFPSFVNGHRVAEARELLQKHPDRTSLSIGMEVGFNSYTAFHAAFSRVEGVPPGKFRRRTSEL